MKTIQQWFDEYAESHQNKTNKLIHWICVPTIFFSIIGLLTAIPSTGLSRFASDTVAPYINFGSIASALGLLFYLILSPRIFIGMLLFTTLVVWGNVHLQYILDIPLWLFSLTLFIVAWAGQFIGHHIEGAKPSFFKDVQFLLIGPAWLMGFIYNNLGIKP